ncbi:MAG: DUF4238 domain-containing protein [Thermoanaerobaculia bacterium]
MRQRAPETDAKLHHLLPQGYMRRFSPDGPRVHVFDRVTGKYRFSGTRNIAAQTDFYAMKTKEGATERWVEGRLAEIDSAVAIFDKIEHGETLTREERWSVAFFMGFADSRGSGFRTTTPPLSARDNLDDDEAFLERFSEAFRGVTGVWLDPWTIKNLVLDDCAHLDLTKGFDQISVMLAGGFELAMHLFWTEWLVGRAPANSAFITSDRPLGLLVRQGGFGDDPFDPRLIRAFPLSPRAALFIGHPTEGPSLNRTTLNEGAVRLANVALARRADRNVLASSEALLRAIVTDARIAAS